MIKIKLDLSALQEALDVVTKTAPPTSGNITFLVASGKLKVISVADLSRCIIIVPCEVSGEGEFALPIQAVSDAVKNRASLELVYDNTVLTIKSGSYKAELATVDVIPLDDTPEEEGQEWKLTPEQGAWLRKSLRDVSMRPTTLLSTWMPVGIKLSSKSSFIVCYDTQRMNWAVSKEVTGDLEILLPIDTMQAIVEVFHKGNFNIKQGKSVIRVRNKLITVMLAVPAADDIPSLQDVQAKIKEATKISADTFTLAKESFLAFTDNAKAVIGKERAEIIVTALPKGLELQVKTGQGQVKNGVKGSGKGSFRIDYEYMQEIVSKATDQMELNVVEGAFLSIKLANSTAIVALNQS